VFRPQNIEGAPWFGWAPNGVGWTLNYEVWFYLLFAVSLFARRARWPVLIGLFAIFSIGVPLLFTGSWSSSVYASYHLKPAILNLGASNMTLEFLAGAVIGAIYHSSLRVRSRELLVGFAVISVVAVICLQLTDDFNHHGITGFGPPMMVMVLALALLDREYPIRAPKSLVWLGNVSFSLYLIHKVVQFGFPKLTPHGIWQFGAAHVIMCLAISLALSHLSYRYLEQGLAAKLQGWLLRRIPKAEITAPPPAASADAPSRLAS
ncbi:MAG TPA: acyltransferase, partial [Kofleriaceae bacterium]